MKKNIVVVILISITFSGCSGNNIAQGLEQAQIQMVGNKPSKGFKFTSLEAMQPYILENKHLSIATPKGYKKDWSKMGGWYGVRNSDRYYVLNLKQTPAGSRDRNWLRYHIAITSSISKYTERESY